MVVIALIGIAVGDELAIAHPGDEPTLGFTIVAFGGPALFLLAQIIFLRDVLGHVPRSRPLGLAALGLLAVATTPLMLIVAIAASSGVLVAVAIADTGSRRRYGAGVAILAGGCRPRSSRESSSTDRRRPGAPSPTG